MFQNRQKVEHGIADYDMFYRQTILDQGKRLKKLMTSKIRIGKQVITRRDRRILS